MAPEHDPLRYFPAAQLALEQVEHAVSDVPEHPPRVYLPDAQVAQAAHLPRVVEEAPCRNCPFTVHDGWSAQSCPRKKRALPWQLPVLYWPALHLTRHSWSTKAAGQLSLTHLAAVHMAESIDGACFLFISAAHA